MTLLLTGGTGLVGQIFVHYLIRNTVFAEEPHKIRLLCRNRNSNPHRQRFISWCISKGIDIVYGDLREGKDVNKFTRIPDPKSSVLIHSGAIFNLWQPFDLLYDVNVNGTKRIIEAFHRNKIRKLVHISSIAVYGTLTGANATGITEDQPLDLQMEKSYELTKALGEKLVQEYMYKHPEKLVIIPLGFATPENPKEYRLVHQLHRRGILVAPTAAAAMKMVRSLREYNLYRQRRKKNQ